MSLMEQSLDIGTWWKLSVKINAPIYPSTFFYTFLLYEDRYVNTLHKFFARSAYKKRVRISYNTDELVLLCI